MTWILVLIALAAGAANPLQAAANAQLNRQLGSPLWAGTAVYVSGLLGLFLLLLLARPAFPLPHLVERVEIWAWFGGLISIASTMAGLVLAQRLGSGVFTGLTITAALAMSPRHRPVRSARFPAARRLARTSHGMCPHDRRGLAGRPRLEVAPSYSSVSRSPTMCRRMKFVAPVRVRVPATMPTICRFWTWPCRSRSSSAMFTSLSVSRKRSHSSG